MFAGTRLPALKQQFKEILPTWLLSLRRYYNVRKGGYKYSNLSTKEIFTKVYAEGDWGASHDQTQKYYSGSGSNDPVIIDPYFERIGDFLSSFENKPSVVDLGCGDFSVGSKIRQFCDSYIACDIVESMINFNQERFKDLHVDFRVVDLIKDDLPPADIVFLRQVLQHLSNREIVAALPRICARYKYLVLTEDVPSAKNFKPNVDKPAGPDTRSWFNSGLVLTSKPFNLRRIKESCLCEVHLSNAIVRTTLYQLS